MNGYYEPHEIGGNIYHIYEPGKVYTSLIIGSQKALLIDTGCGFCDLRQKLKIICGVRAA